MKAVDKIQCVCVCVWLILSYQMQLIVQGKKNNKHLQLLCLQPGKQAWYAAWDAQWWPAEHIKVYKHKVTLA